METRRRKVVCLVHDDHSPIVTTQLAHEIPTIESLDHREEMLMAPDETKIIWKLRRALAGLEQQQALELVLNRLKETSSNVEFLMQVQKSMPVPSGSDGE